MFDWFKKKDEMEILENRYRDLMKKSFKLALIDKEQSELARKEAEEIFEKIQYLSMEMADK